MTEQTRWNLVVSRNTDKAVRSLLAERGGRKGDLSKFVEEAVNKQVLIETVRDVREANKDRDPAEIQRLIDEAMAEVRRERRARAAE
jgi:ribbon-helix-helix protein